MKIRVGMGSCGIAAGALKVRGRIVEEIERRGLDLQVQPAGCIGMCHNEPILDVITGDGRIFTYGHVTPELVGEIFEKHIAGGVPLTQHLVSTSENPNDFLKGQVRVALRNCGEINPECIDDYLDRGGYQALKQALNSTPEEVIQEIRVSGLRGRGGAGFPTWFKWQAVRQNTGSVKYVVCNADEGDPGAFMDRSILEGDPHSVLEGMAIAGYATGAKHGFIYCRAEYPLAVRRLELAIAQARERGLLGRNIFGSGFTFEVAVKEGAGAFVCGEETALIASLEGERGMPRLKPPYPAQYGYWGKPTNINNVETYANVPWIISHGGKAFASMGTEKSKGTKVFALAGKIRRGGLMEVPMGLSLRDVIFNIGGGIKDNRRFKAVQLGGPSGGCIPESLLDIPVDYESINQTGAIMGSGGMVVMDDTTCMVDVARFFLDFTQKESCGKCVQCRIGTRRMLEILERICTGEGRPGDEELLEEIAIQVKEGSLCGLGQSAPNPVLTTLRYFREEYTAHINDKNCPAKQCKALITYRIDPARCQGCGACARKCPAKCISGEKKKPHVIDRELCLKCGNCLDVCHYNAVIIE